MRGLIPRSPKRAHTSFASSSLLNLFSLRSSAAFNSPAPPHPKTAHRLAQSRCARAFRSSRPFGSSHLQTMSTLQEQGNAAFRAKQWDEALSLYERALQAAGLENPSSDAVGTLYSNLCATRMHLHQYDQGKLASFFETTCQQWVLMLLSPALNDANSAVRPPVASSFGPTDDLEQICRSDRNGVEPMLGGLRR